MNPKDIATAWHSVTDRWIVRRNKAHDDGRLWEVVHDWGGTLISDDTQRVLQRFPNQAEADALATECEDEARGTAVLRALAHPPLPDHHAGGEDGRLG